eukprot:3104386-Heterocapsa_arctica.AAC.1
MANDRRLCLPTFPNGRGIAPTKVAVIAAWSRLSSRGTLLRGHSARRSGAKTFARLGCCAIKLSCLGRWASAEL